MWEHVAFALVIIGALPFAAWRLNVLAKWRASSCKRCGSRDIRIVKSKQHYPGDPDKVVRVEGYPIGFEGPYFLCVESKDCRACGFVESLSRKVIPQDEEESTLESAA